MAMYYPQATTLDMGPTEILPRSQYYRGEYGVSQKVQNKQWSTDRHSLTCAIGTVVLIHYDLWHRAFKNESSQLRWMHKFQFSRMNWAQRTATLALPVLDAFDCPDDRSGIVEDIWRFYGGPAPGQQRQEALLEAPQEAQRLAAAYRLARAPGGAEQLAERLVQVRNTSVRRTLIYGLIASGPAAVQPLLLRLPAPSGLVSSANATGQQRRQQEGFDFELAHAATNDQAELHFCIHTALSQIRAPASLQQLSACSEDESSPLSTRIVAVEGLGRFVDLIAPNLLVECVEMLCALTSHPCGDLRCAALLALARWVQTPAARATLRDHGRAQALLQQRAAEDPDRYARAYALEALVRLMAFAPSSELESRVRTILGGTGPAHLLDKLCATAPTSERASLARQLCALRRCALTSTTARW